MIRLQPDVIVAGISEKMDSISKAMSSPHQDPSLVTSGIENTVNITKEENSATVNHNLISALHHVWISSPSQVGFLIGSLQYWHRYEMSRGKYTLEANLRYRYPPWLSSRDWDARYCSAVSSWKFHLQTHLVLPRNHDIFTFAETGNITGLQVMLKSSPSYIAARQDSTGCSPLHVSITERTNDNILIVVL